jgi:hypothetical protein
VTAGDDVRVRDQHEDGEGAGPCRFARDPLARGPGDRMSERFASGASGVDPIPRTRLYDLARHEPLRAVPWKADEVRAAIERIVADTESHFDADTRWPLHPQDRESASVRRT